MIGRYGRRMSVYGWLSLGAQVIGIGMVVAGLYRRDPTMQRWVARARTLTRARVRSWAYRLLRRRRDATVHAGTVSTGTVAMTGSARGSVRPGSREVASSLEERVAWLEHAVDVAFHELDSERRWTTEDLTNLEDQVKAVRGDHGAALERLELRLEQAAVPERLEWWGAAVVVLGLALAVMDAAIGRASP